MEFMSPDQFSRSLPLKDVQQPIKIFRSSSNYRIGVDIRQPSFISLRGHIITKSGECLGDFSKEQEKTTLDQINIINNDGHFDNPIIVIDDDAKELVADGKHHGFPLSTKTYSTDHQNQTQPLPPHLLQKRIQLQLYKRNAQFWEEIGYKPTSQSKAEIPIC